MDPISNRGQFLPCGHSQGVVMAQREIRREHPTSIDTEGQRITEVTRVQVPVCAVCFKDVGFCEGVSKPLLD